MLPVQSDRSTKSIDICRKSDLLQRPFGVAFSLQCKGGGCIRQQFRLTTKSGGLAETETTSGQSNCILGVLCRVGSRVRYYLPSSMSYLVSQHNAALTMAGMHLRIDLGQVDEVHQDSTPTATWWAPCPGIVEKWRVGGSQLKLRRSIR